MTKSRTSKGGAFYLIDFNQYAKYEGFYKEKNTQRLSI